MISSIHDPKRGWTKGMPSWNLLAGTPQQLDPTRCKHTIVQFIATIFRDDRYRHSIAQRFRCQDCGKIHDIPRDVKTAGKRGAVEIDDPRVYKTLKMDDGIIERFHHNEVLDGRYAEKTFQVGGPA